MTDYPPTAIRSALEAALSGDEPVRKLGRAIWLYIALVLAANERGMIIRTRDHFTGVLAVTESEIESWLSRLSNAGLIKIKSPLPYLVIALRFWSGSASHPALRPAGRGGSGGLDIADVPVGSKLQPAEAAQSKSGGDRGAGEGDALLAEVKDTVTDADPLELAGLIREYRAHVVRRALQRVRATPVREIRKSKTALFRYLLAKFSEEIDVRDL